MSTTQQWRATQDSATPGAHSHSAGNPPAQTSCQRTNSGPWAWRLTKPHPPIPAASDGDSGTARRGPASRIRPVLAALVGPFGLIILLCEVSIRADGRRRSTCGDCPSPILASAAPNDGLGTHLLRPHPLTTPCSSRGSGPYQETSCAPRVRVGKDGTRTRIFFQAGLFHVKQSGPGDGFVDGKTSSVLFHVKRTDRKLRPGLPGMGCKGRRLRMCWMLSSEANCRMAATPRQARCATTDNTYTPGTTRTQPRHTRYILLTPAILYTARPPILPQAPMHAYVTVEPSPKPCRLLRQWGIDSLTLDWRKVISVYLPVAQLGPVASPPRTSLLTRSLRLPSSRRRTVPEPPCSVISEGRYRNRLLGRYVSVRTAAPDRRDTHRHVPIGCVSEQGTGHPATNAS